MRLSAAQLAVLIEGLIGRVCISHSCPSSSPIMLFLADGFPASGRRQVLSDRLFHAADP
jgi:hypothetical protein